MSQRYNISSYYNYVYVKNIASPTQKNAFCHRVTTRISDLCMTMNIIYILFILTFVVHDGEEVAVQHRWVTAHHAALSSRLPRLRRIFDHLQRMNTKAFLTAALEELVVLVAITIYALLGGAYAIELWTATFLAFSIHLVVHIIQAIVVRGYIPGLVSSILLLPFSYMVIHELCHQFSPSQLLSYALIGLPLIVANLALAHYLGLKWGK